MPAADVEPQATPAAQLRGLLQPQEVPVSDVTPGAQLARLRKPRVPAPRATPLQREIESAASMAGVPTAIATRLVHQESRGHAHAVSSAGAEGLTQLMPGTAKELGVSDPFNPAENLAGGLRYLAQMKKQFGSWAHALAAYNWGPGNVANWIKSGAKTAALPAETRAYVQAILPAGERAKRTQPRPIPASDVRGASAAAHAQSVRAGPRTIAASDVLAGGLAAGQAAYGTLDSLVNPLGAALDPTAKPSPILHSGLQQLFGVTEYPFVAGNLMTEGRLSGKGELSKLGQMFAADPATTAARYGLNAPHVLRYVAAHAAPGSIEQRWASFNLQHPWETGAETFAGEFLNPANWALGDGAARLGGLVHDALSATEGGRSFLHLASPYRGIAKVAGDAGKNVLRSTVAAAQHVDELAMEQTRAILDGLTHREQIDVVRRMQGARLVGPAAPGAQSALEAPARLAIGGESAPFEATTQEPTFQAGPGRVKSAKNLDLRAKQLNETLRASTRRQVEEGILPASAVYNEARYFPMRGAYKNPALNADEADFIESLRGGSPSMTKLDPILHKHFENIDEALASGMLRDDFSPAEQLYRHLSRRNQNVAVNRGFEGLPETLLRHPDEAVAGGARDARVVPDIKQTRGGAALGRDTGTKLRPPAGRFVLKSSAIATRPLLPASPEEDIYRGFFRRHPEGVAGDERPPDGWVRADEVLPGANLLPALRGAWLKSEFAAWLRQHGGTMLSGQPLKLFGSPQLAEWVAHYNSAFRQAIVANPAYHLLWNIAWNGSAAMGHSMGDLVMNTGRALLGAARSTVPGLDDAIARLGEKGALGAFARGNDAWHTAVQEAIQAGATAEMGATRAAWGGSAADLFTRPWGDLPFAQKMDKFFTQASDWNKRAVFGRLGEQAFATRLYGRLLQDHPPERAAEMTREALGNYQNVDPNSLLSQMFFFWPWLKSNSAFWTKQFLTNPAYTDAPLQAIRRYNELAGDPNYARGPYPTTDFSIYRGTDPQGSAQYVTPPLPQRTAGGMLDALATGRPSEALYEAQKLVRSHATPLVGNVLDAVATQASPADPAIKSGVAFDTIAPPAAQLAQIGEYLLGHDVPIPLAQYIVQDALRRGMTGPQLASELQTAGGVGYVWQNLSEGQRIGAARARKQYVRMFYVSQKTGNSQLLVHAYRVYRRQLRHLGILRR